MKTKLIIRKITGIVLTLALLLTLGVGTFTSSAKQGESENLLADANVSNWHAYKWNDPGTYAKAVLQDSTDSRYGGNAVYNFNVGYQNLYIPLPTEAKSEYNLSFSIKAKELYINIFAITNGSDIPWNSGAEIDRSSTSLAAYSKTSYTTSETEWTDISFDFETVESADVQYYMNIHFLNGGNTNAATISDLSLVKTYPIDTGWLQHQFNTDIRYTNDSHLGGEAIINSSVAYQNLYRPIEVEANSEYELSFSIKAKEVVWVEIFALENGGTPTWISGSNYINSAATAEYIPLAKNVPGISETEWLSVKYKFNTTDVAGKDYYLNIHFGAGGDTNKATVSDLSLVKTSPIDTGWLQHQFNTDIRYTNDSHLGGEAIINSSVAYQNLYRPIEVEANSEYELSFSIKAKEVVWVEIFALENGGTPTWISGSNYINSAATAEYIPLAKNVPGISETEWLSVKYKFNTTDVAGKDYYLNIHFGAGGDTNKATVSDLSLVKTYPVDTGWLQHQFNTDIRYTNDSHLGGEAIINSSVAYQNLYRPIEVEANTKYELSFSIKAKEVVWVEVFALENGGTPTWISGSNYINSAATAEYIPLAKNVPGTSETEWLSVKYKFNTNDVAGKDYYLNIHFGAGGDSNTAIISDLSLVKATIGANDLPNVDGIMSIIGNSMRSKGTQALRYKFSVEKAALETDYFGYSITEYGFIGAYDKHLTDSYGELTFTDGKLTNARSVHGIAYQKSTEKDIVLAETDDTKIVSSALINIGLKNNTIDYNAYAMGLTVRAYVVFENAEGDKIYKYGTGYSASVFETMRTILAIDEESAIENGYDWTLVEKDQQAINEILASVANDSDDKTDLTVGDYYNAYLANN